MLHRNRSVGCTCDGAGRRVFDAWLRTEMKATNSKWCMPAAGSVYDYSFDGERGDHGQWQNWMSTTGGPYVMDPKQQFRYTAAFIITSIVHWSQLFM
jgi:Dynein heavy chain AAA lid domain